MRATRALIVMVGVLGMLTAIVGTVWAGAGNEGDPVCLVQTLGSSDPGGTKLIGTIALDATSGTISDVVLRLERAGDQHFFRLQYVNASGFLQPNLLHLQNNLCSILTSLQSDIFTAFGLTGKTKFVFTPRAISDSQVIPDSAGNTAGNAPITSTNDILVPSTSHHITIANIVVYAQ